MISIGSQSCSWSCITLARKIVHDSKNGKGPPKIEILEVLFLWDKANWSFCYARMKLHVSKALLIISKNSSPTICHHVLKNSMGTPSYPGAFPSAIPSIALKNLRVVKNLISSSFIALVKEVGKSPSTTSIASTKGWLPL